MYGIERVIKTTDEKFFQRNDLRKEVTWGNSEKKTHRPHSPSMFNQLIQKIHSTITQFTNSQSSNKV